MFKIFILSLVTAAQAHAADTAFGTLRVMTSDEQRKVYVPQPDQRILGVRGSNVGGSALLTIIGENTVCTTSLANIGEVSSLLANIHAGSVFECYTKKQSSRIFTKEVAISQSEK